MELASRVIQRRGCILVEESRVRLFVHEMLVDMGISLYNIGSVLGVLGSTTLCAIIGWCIYIRTSRFHVLVNKIPGPSFYLPVIGNALEVAGGLEGKSKFSSSSYLVSRGSCSFSKPECQSK